MIVRDAAKTLPDCLESIRRWVDEMVIVDTGSSDETPRIVEQFGGRLFHFPWCDDFSAARNESLRHARGEWIFWMDSDDTIDESNGQKLHDLAYADDDEVMAHVVQVHCPGASPQNAVTAVDHVKLFRNLPELRFGGRIHEQILPAVRQLNGVVRWTDVFVVHSGSDTSPEAKKRKQARDLRLLKFENDDRPDHPFTLFNLGMTYEDMAEYALAIEVLERCIEVSSPTESHLRKAYALLVSSYSQTGEHEQALRRCEAGLKQYPRDSELLFRQGVLAHRFGDLEAAEETYRATIANNEDRHFSSVDVGITGFKAHHNLALVLVDRERLDLAELQWRLAIQDNAEFLEAWRGLVEVLMKQGKFTTAEIATEQMAEVEGAADAATALRAKVMCDRGDIKDAIVILKQQLNEDADSMESLETLCEMLFFDGSDEEAEEALLKLANNVDNCGAAHHNLGTIYLRTGRSKMAIKSYDNSLNARPDSVSTYVQLGIAHHRLGQIGDAKSAWQRAQVLAPGDPQIASLLQGRPDPTS